MDGHSGNSIYMFLKEPGEFSWRGEGGTLLLNCCMISALVGHHNVILAFGGVLQTSMSEEGPTIRGLS